MRLPIPNIVTLTSRSSRIRLTDPQYESWRERQSRKLVNTDLLVARPVELIGEALRQLSTHSGLSRAEARWVAPGRKRNGSFGVSSTEKLTSHLSAYPAVADQV